MPGMKMVKNKAGKMVPDFAADGVGKMKKGGKPKGMKSGGKPKGMKSGGKTKKMAYGGAAKKPKGMMYGGKPVYKSRMR